MRLPLQKVEIGYRMKSGASRPNWRVLEARVVSDPSHGQVKYGKDMIGQLHIHKIFLAEQVVKMKLPYGCEIQFLLHPVLEEFKSEH